MPTITTTDGAQIFYKDWGSGQPVVFSHGWPLNADAWDEQLFFFASNGYRAIAHDRRGHGRSTQTWTGNDMDTYADDLAALVKALGVEGRDPRRPLDGRRRGRPLHRAPRHRARRQGGSRRRGPATHGEDGHEPGGNAHRCVQPDSQRRSSPTVAVLEGLLADLLRCQPPRRQGVAGNPRRLLADEHAVPGSRPLTSASRHSPRPISATT